MSIRKSIRFISPLLVLLVMISKLASAEELSPYPKNQPDIFQEDYRYKNNLKYDNRSLPTEYPEQPKRDTEQESTDPLSKSENKREPDFDTTLLHDSKEEKTKEKNQKKENQRRRLLIKAEPGDGLVHITWQLYYYNPSPDEEIRYKIYIGTAPEKPAKTIEVKAENTHFLRDLKNYQTYYVQVAAVTKEGLFKSEEVKITPLPSEEQGSSLEKTFSRNSQTLQDKVEAEPFKRQLRQFGYDFFKNTAQLIGSNDNMPVADDYVLGPGDTLTITLWGSLNSHHEVAVDRNGEITIPRVGAVKVWGLTYEKAKQTIEKAISRYFKNFESNITLGRLKSIQVYIVGEVESPGSYPVNSLSTVVNALSAAGGPTKNGSLRNIKVTHPGKASEIIDLYEMLLSGDRSKDLRLMSGDTILVPVIGPVVAIAGEVKRPAIYETKDKQTLEEVLKMAGGITASGYTGKIQIERFSGNTSRVILDLPSHDGKIEGLASGIEIHDRDMVKVFAIQEAVRQVISLKGNVIRPGEYQFRPGMRVKDVITGYSDLLPESYLESAEISRLALPDYHKEVVTVNLRKALEGAETDNIILQEQDSIKVFSKWEMQEKPVVAISGYVVNPGKYDFYQGMTLRDLIAAAGSLKRNALLDTAELSRIEVRDGNATPTRILIDLKKALNGEVGQNLTLKADDVLLVRGITGWTDSTNKFVRLQGEVVFPGIYSIRKGEKLSSVIERAGGFTDKAYLRGAKFSRRSVREEQQKRMDEVLLKTEKEINQKQAALASVAASKEELEATKAALEGLSKNVERMKALKAEGRVVIHLSPLEELSKSSYDLELEGGDSLEIPARSNMINVLGQVYNPTAYVYIPEKSSVEHYLNMSGGATEDAETSEIFIIRADGTVYSRQQSSFGLKWSEESKKWTFGSFMATFLEPGDSLVVPQKLERTAWLRDIKDITTIISQVALTAATVFIGLK